MPGVELIDDLRSDIAAGRVIVLAGAGLSKNVAGSAALDWRALLHTGVQHLASLNEDAGFCQWAENSLKFQFLDPLLSVAEATERRLKERQEFTVWLRRQGYASWGTRLWRRMISRWCTRRSSACWPI